MRLFVMIFLAGLLLAAPAAVWAGAENPLAGSSVAKLTQAIDYSGKGFAKKPIFKGENYVIILFAFQKGQELKAHTIAIDAFVQVLEGTAVVAIDGKEYEVSAGEKISLPKKLSHALTAKENFKMLLVK
ncbi:MAG: cupin domain-containing protein [Thermodesulfobacteriota bacterium]